MLQDIKNTIRQSAIYGLSRISTKLIGLILLPVYSLHFSIAEYGVIGRIETLWQVLWSVYLFGLESGIVKWYTQLEEEDSKKKFLFSVIIFVLFTNILSNLTIYFTSGVFSKIIFQSSNYYHLVVYASLIASLEAVIFIVFLLIRIKEKALLYSLLSILISFINLGLQLYYIYYTNYKLEGVFLARIFSPAIVLVFTLLFFLKNIKFGFDKDNLYKLIKYSLPIMIGSLVVTLLNQSDRYLLAYLSSSSKVGIYILGFNVCGLINFLIISPFSLAFTVISWKKLNDVNASRFYTKTATYLYLAIVYCVLFISLFTPHLIKIFTLKAEYWEAKNIVPWIAYAMPFYGLHFISVFSFYVTGNTKYVLYGYSFALIINVISNFILIPLLDIYGAALSLNIGYLSLILFYYIFSRKEFVIKYEWIKIVKINLLSVLLIVPFFVFKIQPRSLEILLKFVALSLFPLLLYPLNFYEKIEIESIKGFIYKYVVNKIKR